MSLNDSDSSSLTWGQRHGLKLIFVIMMAAFAFVIVIQVLGQ